MRRRREVEERQEVEEREGGRAKLRLGRVQGQCPETPLNHN